MRSEWLPLSASALVTGVMALLMSVFISPMADGGGAGASMSAAQEHPGQWTAMSMLWALSSIGLLLGLPALLTLFPGRGRLLGWIGGVVFAVGALGLSGLAALAVLFGSLASRGADVRLVDAALDAPQMRVMLLFWIFSLFAGWVTMALALLRAHTVPPWVPLLILGFVFVALVPHGSETLDDVAFVALAAAFTGIAVYSVDPGRYAPRKTDALSR